MRRARDRRWQQTAAPKARRRRMACSTPRCPTSDGGRRGRRACGDQMAATDPGSWSLAGAARASWPATSTPTSPSTGPGHTVHMKAVLRWRQRDALATFDRARGRSRGRRSQRQGGLPPSAPRRRVRRSRRVSVPLPPARRSATTPSGAESATSQATSGFEVQEYRKPEFEVIVTPASRFVVQGGEAVASSAGALLLRPAGGQRPGALRRQPAALLLAAALERRRRARTAAGWYGDDQTARRHGDGSTPRGAAQIRVPLAVDENGRDFSARIEAQVTDASSARSSGNTVVHATYGHVPRRRAGRQLRVPRRAATVSHGRFARVDYAGARAASTCRCASSLERLTYPDGLLQSNPTVDRS